MCPVSLFCCISCRQIGRVAADFYLYFAIGNIAGNFYGLPDYPMTVPGLSLGRCHTQGYVTGKYVAGL